MDRKLQGVLGGITATLLGLFGLVAGGLAASPPLIQELLERPLTDTLVAVLLVGMFVCLVVWARRSTETDRLAHAIAVASLGGVVVIANLAAPALGWWRGPYFATRIVPLAMLTGLKAMGGFTLVLFGYRWLARRSHRVAVVLYAGFALLMIPGTVLGDRAMIESGVFAFSNGYRLFHDVALGQVMLILPLIIYEVLSQRWRRHPPHALS